MTLAEFYQTHHALTPAEIEILNTHSVYRKINAKTFLLHSGERSHEFGLVISGVFRYFFYDNKGNEITSLFMSENELVGSISSFLEFIPSSGSIQAVTDCEIIVISRATWELLGEKIPHWEATFQKIIRGILVEKTMFQRSLINSDSQTSYLNFLQTYPTIAQRVSLNYIASFLGITPFSLSRIRKTMASK